MYIYSLTAMEQRVVSRLAEVALLRLLRWLRGEPVCVCFDAHAPLVGSLATGNQRLHAQGARSKAGGSCSYELLKGCFFAPMSVPHMWAHVPNT